MHFIVYYSEIRMYILNRAVQHVFHKRAEGPVCQFAYDYQRSAFGEKLAGISEPVVYRTLTGGFDPAFETPSAGSYFAVVFNKYIFRV